MKKAILVIWALISVMSLTAQNNAIRFYWFHVFHIRIVCSIMRLFQQKYKINDSEQDFVYFCERIKCILL